MADPIVLPEALWRPYKDKSTTPVQHDILVAHTEVGSNEGSIDWGSRSGNPYAHCYTDCMGVTTQVQDLRYRSAAVLEGNPYAICWETEDIDSRCFASWNLTCGQVPAWTDAQVQRLIRDMAWCCVRFDIPPFLIPDTKAGRRGLAYHRQGVPGSPEWVSGSLAWTKAAGKCCPDWRRIDQFVNRVVPGVQAIVFGTGGFMADLTEAEQREILDLVRRLPGLEFVVRLLWDLNAPNGFRYVDPKTGALVAKDTPGAKPVVDVWRWARETAIQARAEPDQHAALADLIKSLHPADTPTG